MADEAAQTQSQGSAAEIPDTAISRSDAEEANPEEIDVDKEHTMLLSRVAESVYWAGRYLERAEATARLVKVHTELFLDLPKSAGIGWTPLLAVTGTHEAFTDGHEVADEDEIIHFICGDEANSSSIISSVISARNNLRVARALLPRSSWEIVNELFLITTGSPRRAVDRRTRLEWLGEVIHRCQWLSGLLAGSMSHDDAFCFLEVGRFLERADMTTRVIDVQAGILQAGTDDTRATFADVTWVSALKSVGAHQMFLRTARTGISGTEAMKFLLTDHRFPRSVEFCLVELSRALLELPRHELPMAACAAAQRLLEDSDLGSLTPIGMHECVDDLQQALSTVHGELVTSYFEMTFTTELLASA